MRLSYSRALRILHRTYRHLPLTRRAHILGRFLTCPFLRTLEHVAANAQVLDLGAGDGVFARLAAESQGARVVALEPDLRKALPSFQHVSIRFIAGYDSAIRGSFDLIAMFDVLYRVPLSDWDRLFRDLHSQLAPGGSLMIKELDPANRVKFLWNRFQEAISDRFLKLTIGDAFSYETREEIVARLTRAGFRSVDVREIDRGYPHSHILYLARK